MGEELPIIITGETGSTLSLEVILISDEKITIPVTKLSTRSHEFVPLGNKTTENIGALYNLRAELTEPVVIIDEAGVTRELLTVLR